MNWGKAIVLAFIGFAGFIGTLVYLMCRQRIDLVREDYYQDEIAYQRHIERVANARQLPTRSWLRYEVDTQQMQVSRPTNLTTGTLLLYCPADRRQDVTVALTATTPVVRYVPMRGRPSGRWRAKLTWSDGQRAYFIEQDLVRP